MTYGEGNRRYFIPIIDILLASPKLRRRANRLLDIATTQRNQPHVSGAKLACIL